MSQITSSLMPDSQYEARWVLPGVPVPCTVVATKKILEGFDADVFAQAGRCCRLPGAVRAAIMPDAHSGYGPCVGFVGAYDAEEGVITPYGVGSDIGCGMRVLKTNLTRADFSPDRLDPKQRAKLGARQPAQPAESGFQAVLRMVMQAIERRIPLGHEGHKHDWGLDRKDFLALAQHGIHVMEPGHKHRLGYLVERYSHETFSDDFENVEESALPVDPGYIDDDNLNAKSFSSAHQQVGTLGSGNHFIEIQEVAGIDPSEADLAQQWGLFAGQVVIMFHSGSRYWGKTLCDYYTGIFRKACQKKGIALEDRNLAYAPTGSELFNAYFNLMNAACNFAVANRHVMMVETRRALREVLGRTPQELGAHLLYDIAHNNAKWETWDHRQVIVLRKGATRAFPAGHAQLRGTKWEHTGHPVITPGSMGSHSHILVGRPEGHDTLYSINHGGGRAMSRAQAAKHISDHDFWASMGAVLLNQRNAGSVKDEAPAAYKNIDEVIRSVRQAKLARLVATLRPLGVIKG